MAIEPCKAIVPVIATLNSRPLASLRKVSVLTSINSVAWRMVPHLANTTYVAVGNFGQFALRKNYEGAL
jgi:hypothetical protein